MKMAEKDKPIYTTPNGVWESSRSESEKENRDKNYVSTDLQGNGYPPDTKKGK